MMTFLWTLLGLFIVLLVIADRRRKKAYRDYKEIHPDENP
jgi:hypothetical protein